MGEAGAGENQPVMAWLYVLLLTSPLWGLFLYIDQWTLVSPERWLPSLLFTLNQALLSSVGALVLGFLMSLGLLFCDVREERYKIFRYTALLLIALPSLIWISAYFWWASIFEHTPRGITSIVVVHAFMNVGVVALGLETVLRSRLGHLSEVSRTLSVPPLMFWRRVVFPLIGRDLLLLFAVVFGFCFTSLSVPLIFSTPRHTTLEVLIFQWGVREGLWGQALMLSMLQWIFIAVLVLPAGAFRVSENKNESSWKWLIRKELQVFFIIPVIFLVSAYVDLLRVFTQKEFWLEVSQIFSWSSFLGSFAVGSSVAFLTLLLLLGMGLVSPDSRLRWFFKTYAAPSTAVMGVFLFLIPGHTVVSELVKLAVGMCLLFFPSLYRWLAEAKFGGLHQQWIQARVLGATPWMIARRVIWPQSKEVMAWMSGLACLWSLSDFALSGMLLQRPYSLALIASQSFNRYRIEIGLTYTLFCLLLGLAFVFFLRKCLNVRH